MNRFPLMHRKGGIGYHSYIETSFSAGGESFRNISKSQVTTNEIVVRSANQAPTIRFLAPSAGRNTALSDLTFDIIFEADDPDNVAQIRLFVDDDSLNFDGTFIPGALLLEGFDTSFKLNLLEIPDFDPTLEYFIYAEITDGVSSPNFVYADGSIVAAAGLTSSDGGDETSTVVTEDLTDALDYVKFTNDGRVFSFGDAPIFENITSTTGTADLEFTPTTSGYIAVQVDGLVFGSGDIDDFTARLQSNGQLLFEPEEIAFLQNDPAGGELIVAPGEDQLTIDLIRDIEVDWEREGIYVLDGDGDMLYLGNANTDIRPEAIGLDLYRDMELSPDGNQMYFLTGNGIFTVDGNGSPVDEWSDVIQEDKYRDIELVVDVSTVLSVIVVDNDGKLTVLGNELELSATELEKTVSDIPEGTVRQVKTFPGRGSRVLMFVEGSGQVHIAVNGVDPGGDALVFADGPGINDDRIVDTETLSINPLQVVAAVNDILKGFKDEDIGRIMSHVSPNYQDRTGADADGLRKSLETLFSFYEIESYAVSSEDITEPFEPFVLTRQRDRVSAQVFVSQSFFSPFVQIEVPQLDQAGDGIRELSGNLLFTGSRIPFDQDIRLREVSDGRTWKIELWDIRNFGRQQDDIITNQEVEVEDITFLTRQADNRRIGIYTPKNQSIDEPMFLHIDIDERDPFEPINVLAIFPRIGVSC